MCVECFEYKLYIYINEQLIEALLFKLVNPEKFDDDKNVFQFKNVNQLIFNDVINHQDFGDDHRNHLEITKRF